MKVSSDFHAGNLECIGIRAQEPENGFLFSFSYRVFVNGQKDTTTFSLSSEFGLLQEFDTREGYIYNFCVCLAGGVITLEQYTNF